MSSQLRYRQLPRHCGGAADRRRRGNQSEADPNPRHAHRVAPPSAPSPPSRSRAGRSLGGRMDLEPVSGVTVMKGERSVAAISRARLRFPTSRWSATERVAWSRTKARGAAFRKITARAPRSRTKTLIKRDNRNKTRIHNRLCFASTSPACLRCDSLRQPAALCFSLAARLPRVRAVAGAT